LEHFVTLFDQAFLAMGLALHRSLQAQVGSGRFMLWMVCMDEEVEASLRQLNLADVTLIPLREIETEALLAVKPGRSRGEYCWTMTPFAPSAVMQRAPQAERVTYLDADLYFFDAPQILFDEFEQSGKHVLITDHAYAPEYDVTAKSGRFCVQFMTFRRSEPGLKVLHSWQAQCIEWCFARYEPGRFGDQKYLDEWPTKFAGEVHVLRQVERTLAPWNASYFAARGPLRPVFYHFQGFRLIKGRTVVCSLAYRITAPVRKLYEAYIGALGGEVDGLEARGIRVVRLPRPPGIRRILRDLRDAMHGKAYWSQI
jgi:hypothetical protein